MRRAKGIEQTEKLYRRQKRKEFMRLAKALNDINLGCFYLPKEAYKKLAKGRDLIREAHAICKPWWKGY